VEVLVFGGTWEGRTLAQQLADTGISVLYSVATDYGRDLIPTADHLTVHTGRMEEGEMEALMETHSFSYVVDATHPYAALVSENIRHAAERCGIPYRRVLRPGQTAEGVISVPSAQAAAQWLAEQEGNIFLTTGSKDLYAYSAIPNYKERLWVRVLPSAESLQLALEQGIPAAHIICMQGPFSQEMNTATLRQINAKYMVTKDSGKVGGFTEKIAAAREAGAQLLVISRPTQEEGDTLEELLRQLLEEAKA
jgi:precorrin-2 dehydrogenase/sirohydrochlorin ferrochelatase/precorrin-6A/cobalt-precorrin-6A reductase